MRDDMNIDGRRLPDTCFEVQPEIDTDAVEQDLRAADGEVTGAACNFARVARHTDRGGDDGPEDVLLVNVSYRLCDAHLESHATHDGIVRDVAVKLRALADQLDPPGAG